MSIAANVNVRKFLLDVDRRGLVSVEVEVKGARPTFGEDAESLRRPQQVALGRHGAAMLQ